MQLPWISSVNSRPKILAAANRLVLGIAMSLLALVAEVLLTRAGSGRSRTAGPEI